MTDPTTDDPKRITTITDFDSYNRDITDKELWRARANPRAYRLECEQRERDFLKRHRLKEYRWAHYNIFRFVSSGGREEPIVRRFMKRHFPCGWEIPHAFDHQMILGRKRIPLMMVGHPYGMGKSDRAILEDMRELGLDVAVEGVESSLYGWGTWHVRVTSPLYAEVTR